MFHVPVQLCVRHIKLAYSAIKQWGGTYVSPQDGFQHCALSHALYTKVKLATLKKRYCQKERSHQQGTAIIVASFHADWNYNEVQLNVHKKSKRKKKTMCTN